MTAIWGPLGWMTLHSVATIYPEEPSQAEKVLMNEWLDMFRDTITCSYCRQHFTEMLARYRRRFPGMLASRQELVAFTFRAHNNVNRRLYKPVYGTVEECMSILRNNVSVRPAAEYRKAYLAHIKRYWRTMQDVSGIVAARKLEQMVKVESDYFAQRDTNFAVDIAETFVSLPYGVIEDAPEIRMGPSVRRQHAPLVPVPQGGTLPDPGQAAPVASQPVRRSGFQITGGKLRLRL